MKIDEAIDYNETRAKDLEFRGFDREAQAQRLGIEALKRHQANRNTWDNAWVKPLPGETE